MLTQIGGRKFALGLVFLVFCFVLDLVAIIYGATEGWNAAGLASLHTSTAAGMLTVVWGNVKEHQSRNGGDGGKS